MHASQGLEAANDFYDQHVWPSLLLRWRAQDHGPRCNLSLHTLGTSPEALILAATALRSEQIYIFYTDESEKYLDRVEAELGKRVWAYNVSKDDPTTIYQRFQDVLQRYPHADIAVDITSGTKPMVTGLGAAAFSAMTFGYKLRVFYVNGEFDPAARRPRAGSEALIQINDPLGAFGDLEYQTAKALYNAQEYTLAAREFIRIADRTGDVRRFSPYAKLSEAYAAWLSNRFESAAHAFEGLFSELDKPGFQTHPLREQLPVLKQQHDGVLLLTKLVDAYDDPAKRVATLSDAALVLWLLASLELMQSRFAEAGNFTAAGLLCYRSLEVTSQHRLATYRFDSLAANYPALPVPQDVLQDAYTAAWQKVASKKQAASPRPLPPQGQPVPLFESYLLLGALEDPLVKALVHRQNDLMGLAELRNQSLWIHGYKPISEKAYRKLASLLSPLHEALLQLEGRSERCPASAVPLP